MKLRNTRGFALVPMIVAILVILAAEAFGCYLGSRQ